MGAALPLIKRFHSSIIICFDLTFGRRCTSPSKDTYESKDRLHKLSFFEPAVCSEWWGTSAYLIHQVSSHPTCNMSPSIRYRRLFEIIVKGYLCNPGARSIAGSLALDATPIVQELVDLLHTYNLAETLGTDVCLSICLLNNRCLLLSWSESLISIDIMLYALKKQIKKQGKLLFSFRIETIRMHPFSVPCQSLLFGDDTFTHGKPSCGCEIKTAGVF